MTPLRPPQEPERADEYCARLLVEVNYACELELLDVLGAQGVVDYAICRDGTVLGALEVGRNTDPRRTSGSRAFEIHANEPIEAPSLQMSWTVSAWADTSWHRLAANIVDVLGRLEAAGRTEFDVHDPAAYRAGTPQSELASMRVIFARSFPATPARVDLGSAGGFTSSVDPDDAIRHHVGWLASAEKDPTGITRKLMAHPGPERHAFVWTDMQAQAAAWRPLWEGSPTQPPALPSGITGLWIVDMHVGVFWTSTHGWRQVDHRDVAVEATRQWFSNERQRYRKPQPSARGAGGLEHLRERVID